ncbi:MerR family transcriptional regulator [Marinomonas gallaica]|uniref:MerR family transcriptional regulator n=1 Tax=Marinomonas gallaica TaxID=1806667 RepID=UPI000835C682|nr:MerR family transcriptional regulator [Marinomonas gallaica]
MNITTELIASDYFPIRILSEQTGVNSVTLRAWERRYGLLKPFRTEKGHRLYCLQDVERVKRILYWINQGVSVGKVRALLDSGSDDLRMKGDEDQWPDWQWQFIAAVVELNQSKWQRLFQEASKQYPVSVLLKKGLLPALQKLRNQKSALVARLCLQSALVERVSSIKTSGSKVKTDGPITLIINADNSALMSHLVCWSLSESQQLYRYIEGVKTAAEVSVLVGALQPGATILVAESLTQAEAEKWLSFLSEAPLENLSLIGSGFWLGVLDTKPIVGIKAYSDVSAFLS